MSFATLCAGLALRVGVQAAAPWLTNQDLTVQEVAAFVREGLAQVASDGEWQALERDATWRAEVLIGVGDGVSAPPEPAAGGLLFELPFPDDFDRLIPDTVWCQGQSWRAWGPVSSAEWERLRRDGAGPSDRAFMVAGGKLLLRGAAAGDTVTARYRSTGLTQAGGVTFTSDADVALLDERLVGMAAEMLYRDAKGLPPGAAGRYPSELDKARGRDRPVGVLSLGRRGGARRPSTIASPDVVAGDGNLGILL